MVMGSDGLFDNLYDHDLEPCLIDSIKPTNNPDMMFDSDPAAAATCIAKKAYSASKEKNYNSPFARGAREHY